MAEDPAVEEVIRRLVSPTQQAFSPGTGDFQAAFDQAMREIARSRLGIGNLQQLQTGRLNTDYSLGTRDLGTQREEILKSLADRLAGQGILRSGINIEEQGNVQRDYTRDLEQLGLARTRGLEDLTENVKAAEQELLNREEQLRLQKAQWDQQQALASAQSQAAAGVGFNSMGQFGGGGGGGGYQGTAARRVGATITPRAPVGNAPSSRTRRSPFRTGGTYGSRVNPALRRRTYPSTSYAGANRQTNRRFI